MRIACVALMLAATLPACAQETTVRIHSARPFGYFVGDLIHARIDVSAPADAVLSRASLPNPGPLTGSLDLRDVKLSETSGNGARLWRLDLTYQNFYVALDARDIEIPGFELSISTATGAQTVAVPAWRIGVSPLREVAPQKQEQASDYLRPDGSSAFVDEATPLNLTFGAAAAALLALALVARDRAWPPFQQRKARVFSALARQISTRRGADGANLAATIQSVHRALDRANGAILLSGDVPEFLRRHPEFKPLRVDFERFFETSKRRFFGGESAMDDDFAAEQLVQFVGRLARRERSG